MNNNLNHIDDLLSKLGERISTLIEFLEHQRENNWSRGFKNFLNRLKNNENPQQVARDVISCYGGMGSFSDLVLVKNQNMLVEENNFLQMLKESIYCICVEIITYKNEKPL